MIKIVLLFIERLWTYSKHYRNFFRILECLKSCSMIVHPDCFLWTNNLCQTKLHNKIWNTSFFLRNKCISTFIYENFMKPFKYEGVNFLLLSLLRACVTGCSFSWKQKSPPPSYPLPLPQIPSIPFHSLRFVFFFCWKIPLTFISQFNIPINGMLCAWNFSRPFE